MAADPSFVAAHHGDETVTPAQTGPRFLDNCAIWSCAVDQFGFSIQKAWAIVAAEGPWQ